MRCVRFCAITRPFPSTRKILRIRSGWKKDSSRPKEGESPFPATVYFLTNGTCASTCLIFADKVLMVPDVRLVSRGLPTPRRS
jgi:hypothetical protein